MFHSLILAGGTWFQFALLLIMLTLIRWLAWCLPGFPTENLTLFHFVINKDFVAGVLNHAPMILPSPHSHTTILHQTFYLSKCTTHTHTYTHHMCACMHAGVYVYDIYDSLLVALVFHFCFCLKKNRASYVVCSGYPGTLCSLVLNSLFSCLNLLCVEITAMPIHLAIMYIYF